MTSLLKEWINPQVLDAVQTFEKEFHIKKPFPHIQISSFLNEAKAEQLLKEIKKIQFEEKEADLFHFKQSSDFVNIQNPLLKEFHACVNSQPFREFIATITGVPVTQAKGIDMTASLYESTHFLLCHDDQLEGRKIAYLFYLTKDFSEKEGASFNVLAHDAENHPTKVEKRYIPEWNSFLMFEVSPVSFHEVEENYSSKKRYAIGGWLH